MWFSLRIGLKFLPAYIKNTLSGLFWSVDIHWIYIYKIQRCFITPSLFRIFFLIDWFFFIFTGCDLTISGYLYWVNFKVSYLPETYRDRFSHRNSSNKNKNIFLHTWMCERWVGGRHNLNKSLNTCCSYINQLQQQGWYLF